MSTALVQSHQEMRARYALDHLLHRLKGFIRVYPRSEADPLPDHDIAWVMNANAGPESTLLDAIKMHPELWAHALPPEVCIVSKADMEKLTTHMPGVAEVIAQNGVYYVDRQAAIARRAFEDEEDRKRFARRGL